MPDHEGYARTKVNDDQLLRQAHETISRPSLN